MRSPINPDPSKNFIYALCEPEPPYTEGYIGASTRGTERTDEHMKPSVIKEGLHRHVYKWIAKRKIEGRWPLVVKILEDGFTSIPELLAAERDYIAYYKSIGRKLTNATDGGEGAFGHRHTEENKRKMGEKKKGKKLNLTEEQRQKRSEDSKKRVWSDESRAKLSASLTGKKLSPGHIEKIRQRSIGNTYGNGWVPTEEQKRKMVENKKPYTEEQREANRQRNLGNQNGKGWIPTEEQKRKMKENRPSSKGKKRGPYKAKQK